MGEPCACCMTDFAPRLPTPLCVLWSSIAHTSNLHGQIDGEVRDKILCMVEDYARVLPQPEFKECYGSLLVGRCLGSPGGAAGFMWRMGCYLPQPDFKDSLLLSTWHTCFGGNTSTSRWRATMLYAVRTQNGASLHGCDTGIPC